MFYYSAQINGFYDVEADENGAPATALPADAVLITPERHAELLDGQSNGFEIKPGADGYPVNAPVKPEFVSGWDTATETWLIDEEAKAAAEQAATVKAQQLAALQTAFLAYIAGLNAKYTGLNLDPATDDKTTALTKCLSCTAPDGTTGMIAADSSTLDWYNNKLKSL